MDQTAVVTRSALWAAYGDALGFMTELADKSKVVRRTGTDRIESLMDWNRDLPGRPVRSVAFPAGTYSDDTQLRLATGRAIRADGRFDVAAFAKVELPTWANYALGAGISSKEAAFSLAKSSTHWYSNFFSGKRAEYVNGGGNGASMRIQPHVWAAPIGVDRRRIVLDVVKNAICTHGHPRGILGAVFHALCLRFYMASARPADILDLSGIAEELTDVWDIVANDPDLKLFWIPQAQSANSRPLQQAFDEVISEIRADLELLRQLGSGGRGENYIEGLRRLHLFDGEHRGSAVKTSVIAAWQAWQGRQLGANRNMVLVANALGSDTDSIATMMGALIGCLDVGLPDGDVQDQQYIKQEAARLAQVAMGTATSSFGYPDLRSYKPPKTAVDVVLSEGNAYVVSGLGRARPLSPFLSRGDQSGDLRWLELETGQSILAHIRQEPKPASGSGQMLFAPERKLPPKAQASITSTSKPQAFGEGGSVASAAEKIKASGFDPKVWGNELLALARDGSDEKYIERMTSLTAIVGWAYRARKRQN